MVYLVSRNGVGRQSCHYWPDIAAQTKQSGQNHCHGELNMRV